MAQPPETPTKPKAPAIENKPISTPSAKGLASRNKSQNINYLAEDVKLDLVADIEASQSCDVDVFLQYFLYLSLKPEKRAELDRLQTRIEKLEISLDTKERDNPIATATPLDKGTSNSANATSLDGESSTNIKANPTGDDKSGAVKANPALGSSDESTLASLREQRSVQLEQLFDECMNKVIPLCAHPDLRQHLSNYACDVVGDETQRYAPYVMAANLALDLLKSIEFDSFRAPSSLDIRFHRNDPKHIISHYEGMVKDIQRVPDVIITSPVAAQDAALALATEYAVREPPTPIYDLPPIEGFPWHSIFSCHEFKLTKFQIMPRLPNTYDKIYHGKKYDPNADEISKDPHEVDASVAEGPETDQSEPVAKRMKLDIPSSSGAGGSNTEPKPRGTSRPASRPGSKGPKVNSTRGSKGSKGSRGASTARSKDGSKVAVNPQTEKTAIAPKTQCGTYGLEMMSVAPGVHHAITCLIVDSRLWIFYYDRQGILQSYGMDFILNLPRFLMLLFAFQRFELEDWGVMPMLNPQAKLAHDPRPPVNDQQRRSNRQAAQDSWDFWRRHRQGRSDVNGCLDVQDGKIELSYPEGDPAHPIYPKIDVMLSNALSPKPHTICGRAGAVFVASATGYKDIVCKIYNPEVERASEGTILQRIYKKVEERKVEWIKPHLPTMLFCGDIPSCSTNRIRSMTALDWRGHRTMRFLVFRKLRELTELTGEGFIKAWFDIVVCHAYLWDMGIHHGDPSLWNSLYDLGASPGASPGENKGVLSDFDLATLEDMPRRPGHERTGTIPFMSIALLTKKYWDGLVPRMYHHELEALIWILPFVFLRYPKGQAVSETKVDAWMTPDYDACREKKSDFCFPHTLSTLYEEVVMSEGDTTHWKKEWKIAAVLITWVSHIYFASPPKPWETNKPKDGKNNLKDGKNNLEEQGIRKSVKETRKAFIETCRDELSSDFPYICDYLDTLQTSLSTLS